MPGRRLRWWSQGIFGPDHLLQSCIKAIVDLACLTCWGRWRDWGRQQDQQAASAWVSFRAVGKGRGALCVQLDFTRTFKTMCNNINCVWSHFYKMLVVLKYHRRPWANIFHTDICRRINIQKKSIEKVWNIAKLRKKSRQKRQSPKFFLCSSF